jgi:hypothetical protein
MNGPFDFDQLVALIGGRLGKHEVACSQCGPQRHAAANRRRRVLCIWHPEPCFVTYGCARCGIGGYAIDGGRERVSHAELEEMRRKAKRLDDEEAAKRLKLARWLWSNSRPIAGTIAEKRYLRERRDISGTLPGTLRFKPATDDHPPALIAAFGLPAEPEPGVLTISHTAIAGVHLTRLLPDGSDKREREDEPAKIMIGRSLGWPIVLAPVNDAGGLGITEGIEDGLSVLVTGLGIWAAGSASRLPALAARVPSYVNDITIFAHTDDDGMRHAVELKRRLHARGLSAAIADPRRTSDD